MCLPPSASVQLPRYPSLPLSTFRGLAKTLEEAGKLEQALGYSQQALEHRLSHEGPDGLVDQS